MAIASPIQLISESPKVLAFKNDLELFSRCQMVESPSRNAMNAFLVSSVEGISR